MAQKTISETAIAGQAGVCLVEGLLLSVGFVWHATTGSVEAGLDGFIELREPQSGRATNTIVTAQVKSTKGQWPGETDAGFHFVCDERDLTYWLGGNTSTVLFVARPHTDEVYWKALQPYFAEPGRRAARRVEFDKLADRLTAASGPALARLASARVGAMFQPRARPERLITNLVPVMFDATQVWSAPAKYATGALASAALQQREMWLPTPWYIKGGRVFSFHDFSAPEWCIIAEPGARAWDPLAEWADSDDAERQRDFARLLNLALGARLRPHVHSYREKGRNMYAFKASKDLSAYKMPYQGRLRNSSLTVFGPHGMRDDGRPWYCRAHAFEGRFHRLDGAWHLEIVPTYRFTTDGRAPDPRADEHMSGIKRLDGHQAVAGQLRMWADILQDEPVLLVRPQRFIRFGSLVEVEVGAGIDEAAWTARDEDEHDGNADRDLDEEPADDGDGESGGQMMLFSDGRAG